MSAPQIGKCYYVKFDDCCVYGEFTATVIAIGDAIVFDNGVILRNLLAVEFTEVHDTAFGNRIHQTPPRNDRR